MPRRPVDPRRTPPGVPPAPGHPYGAAGRQEARDTSGVEVRLGSRSARSQERRRERNGRRNGLIAALSVAGVAVVVAGGLLLMPGSGEQGDTTGTPQAGITGVPSVSTKGRAPRAGGPVEVATADGSRYRIAAVNGGAGGEAATQSGRAAGASVAFVEYVLSNPTKQNVLLDFPGDVFVRRDLVAVKARGRCMWQSGVPESMCTPPTKSEVVRRVSGGPLVAGDGGDKFMAPGGSYLVRATVEVPVDKRLKRSDLRLYIWRKLYVDDQVAREARFPR